jgi:hypothetical protein
MHITLPLQPQEEARLIAVARSKGISTETLVREAVDRILADASEPVEQTKLESRPVWEMILDNMRGVPTEEFATLPRDGASEVDHYLYGHPKRDR